MNKYYLRIDNNDNFGFVVDGIHTILDTDYQVHKDEYDMFFKLQSEGKQFRLKVEKNGVGLFNLIEEYIPAIDTKPTLPTIEDRVQAIEELILSTL